MQVRGYDTGELATCRNFLETAVELRGWLALPKGITQRVFAFAERGELRKIVHCRTAVIH